MALCGALEGWHGGEEHRELSVALCDAPEGWHGGEAHRELSVVLCDALEGCMGERHTGSSAWCSPESLILSVHFDAVVQKTA